ncbi:scabin-related ADP-ribosyltransferase [Vibrio ouci]|uniref:Pierisin-like domain-containing protein n=1 Tax=Vibrio ouci TaxID=2499078 RepID=A0A4Y8WCC6_9VIBR|nr:hypothetical protein [Vibrio ouci]TFH90038.1 hypothetical protein ELS82_19140 [Vibrio ouci]
MLFTDDFGRIKRIVARKARGKSLPRYVYRWDRRTPEEIKRTGFQPWNHNGDVSVIEHVKNSFAAHRPNPGMNVKEHSQFVSTGSYGMLSTLDPVFAQQVLNTNLYKIDTSLGGMRASDFFDVNDVFDRARIQRPYRTQREWAKQNGIPQEAVVEVMSGSVFMSQYDFKKGAPNEDKLIGWNII